MTPNNHDVLSRYLKSMFSEVGRQKQRFQFEDALFASAEYLRLQPTSSFLNQWAQLYAMVCSHHSIALVGDAGVGKTSALEVIQLGLAYLKKSDVTGNGIDIIDR
jgi:ABC-type transport system involved in cytochrome bd biosynthesis fused ATPase/permease subunit